MSVTWNVVRVGVAVLSACACVTAAESDGIRLEEIQRRADRFGSLVSVPVFERTASEIQTTLRRTIAEGNAALDAIAGLKKPDFNNTARALDDLAFASGSVANRFSLIKETSTDATLREAATEALKELEEWAVGLDYREDVYRVLKTYADTKPRLEGEDAKLLFEAMRDYRRAGLDLPVAERNEVERLRKQLSGLTTDYESNINKARKLVKFTRQDLEGVPESFLEQIKTGADEHTVQANVTWHYIMVMDNARREGTRKRLLVEQNNLAREDNVPLLGKILPLRNRIARKLGYQTWADYVTEVKMVKNAETAIDFLKKLQTGLEPKFQSELSRFREIKVRETGDANAQVQIWDWRYLSNELKKQQYSVDAEQLRVYFPYDRVLRGMFDIYQHIFGLRFERVTPPYKWIEDLQLFAVTDAMSGEPLGLFYLDMFPREGKYNHFAHFGIIEGKLLQNGKHQRPTVALVCNFPAPSKDKPSLLSHSDVETLFHEFGHAMHSMMTRARHVRFSGTSVPRDFVEAPSQMLENWVWDKKVLDSFAADYRDPSKKIPGQVLSALKEARLATEGTRYRRQISFGLTDLVLHTRITDVNASEALPLSNRTLSDVFLPLAPDTAFVAYFGHLMHYDAGYYGYAWADAIAADMATVFERSRNGYFDEKAGGNLRKEIYAPGDSRDVNISIRRFLGRKQSLEPFFKKIGIEKSSKAATAKKS